MVWGNCLARSYRQVIVPLCNQSGCGFSNYVPETCHDSWINSIIHTETQPVWICDTDVVFWNSVEDWFTGTDVLFAGRHEPEFVDDFNNTVRAERLHTAVTYINPPKLRMAMRMWAGRFPGPFGPTAQLPLIRQYFIPRRNNVPMFYDTMTGLYQAGMGTQFTEEQNQAFDHLHCATYVDKVAEECELGKEMMRLHKNIYDHHILAKGIRIAQDQYLASKHT